MAGEDRQTMHFLLAALKIASAATLSWVTLNRIRNSIFSQHELSFPTKKSETEKPRPQKLFGQPTEECSEVALVDNQLQALIRSGAFDFPGSSDLSNFVQPASIDIPVSGTIYLIKEKIIPFQQRVSELIDSITLEEKVLDNKGAVLLKGQTYLVHCGKVKLPAGARGCLSPKSSIGRVDVMVRGVVDECGLYDIIPACKNSVERDLWLEISPRSFNIRVREGVTLTQLMVFMPWDKAEAMFVQASMTAQIDEGAGTLMPLRPHLMDLHEERVCFDENGTLLPVQLHKGAVVLSVRVPSNGLAGFEALSTEDVIDLSQVGSHDPSRFFRPLPAPCAGAGAGGRRLTLEKDRFYILATKERVSVPLHLSAEMVPFSHHVGELRAHYAGFFDPGFGYGREGEIAGTVGVLEVRPHETINIYDGQPICLMDFFLNAASPTRPYGFSGSNYQCQKGPMLAKYFAKAKRT